MASSFRPSLRPVDSEVDRVIPRTGGTAHPARGPAHLKQGLQLERRVEPLAVERPARIATHDAARQDALHRIPAAVPPDPESRRRPAGFRKPPGGKPDGAVLRLTAVAGGKAVEALYRLD